MKIIALITIIIPLLLFLWMFPLLLIRYPLKKFNISSWRSNSALSDYGAISTTKLIYNTVFLSVGILLTINTFVLNNLQVMSIEIFLSMLLSTISIGMIGLFPVPFDISKVTMTIFHWVFAIIGLLLYPLSLFSALAEQLSFGIMPFISFSFFLTVILVAGFATGKKITTELGFIVLSTALCFILNLLIFSVS